MAPQEIFTGVKHTGAGSMLWGSSAASQRKEDNLGMFTLTKRTMTPNRRQTDRGVG